MASEGGAQFWNWTYFLTGTASLILVLKKLDSSLSRGVLEFAYHKVGLLFSGWPAAVIYLALVAACLLLAYVGWRGLR